jgi:hypothetical protein
MQMDEIYISEQEGEVDGQNKECFLDKESQVK